MTKKDKETIIKKIQKCFSLASSSNENEAAVAVKKAKELLNKYNLTMVDISAFESPSEIITSKVGEDKRHAMWEQVLLAKLAVVFDCKSFVRKSRNSKPSMNVVGFPVDVEIFSYTYDYLVRVIDKLYRKALKVEKSKSNYWDKKRTFAFKSGFSVGCCERIVERIKEDRDKALQANVDSRALVLTKSKSVSTWAKENLNLKTRTTRYNPTGYDKGRSAADGISLRDAISRSNNANMALA